MKTLKIFFLVNVLLITSFTSVWGTDNKLDIQKVEKDLAERLEQDQAVRNEINDIDRSTENGMTLWKEVYERLLVIDKENQEYVSDLLDTYGWPEELSMPGHMALFMIIDHGPQEYIERYYTLVEQAERKGYLPKGLFPNLADRRLMISGKEQVYGTQVFNKMNTDTLYIWPVQHPDSLEQLREEAGLISMEQYIDLIGNNGFFKVLWVTEMTTEEANDLMYGRK